MKRLLFFFLTCMVVVIGFAQTTNHTPIPKDAIFYNARWQGVATANKAAYYRVLTIDNRGDKMFYDYYITGQLRAEKHYISINRQDDKLTKLEGVCRTFYKSGRVESVMQYKNGVANGRALSFFPSGKVGMKLNYRNGVLDGPCYAYNEQGRVEYTTIWRDGSRISDSKGGKDYYINKVTNEDEFCERYCVRERVNMAQSRQVNTSTIDDKKIEKHEAPASKVTSSTIKRDESQQANRASVPQQKVSKEMTEEERLIAEVKYPDAPAVVTESLKGNSPKKGKVRTPNIPDECLFPFPYLCHILLDDTERLKDMPSLVALSKVFALKDSQTINGYSTQKEIIFHHNMYYDEQTGQDKVVGKQPRQIGYLGTYVDYQLILERINLFTWSSDEMLSFARQAIKAGYHVLGGGDYQSLDGNFILEPKSSKVSDGSRSVLITFTHQPNLYGGLYHIQMDVR